MVNVRTQKESRNRGAAAAEAALVLPLILMVTFGAIKYGWLFLKAQQITNAARHGARMVVLPDVGIGDAVASMIDLLSQANITATEDDIAITSYYLSGDVTSPLYKLAYNVHITIPSDRVDLLPNFPLLPDVNDLEASVTMAEEGN